MFFILFWSCYNSFAFLTCFIFCILLFCHGSLTTVFSKKENSSSIVNLCWRLIKIYKIPLDSVRKGIELCKDNVRRLLDDARTLIKKHTWQAKSHAVALIVLAIEELGKAKVLSDGLQQAIKKGIDIVEVEEALFRLHGPKFEEGCSLIPSAALVIEEAAYDRKFFDPDVFVTEDVEVNPKIRLEATFVDWNDTKKMWKIGTPATEEKIENLIIKIENALEKI